MAIGLVAAGALLDSWALTQRVTGTLYRESQPVSATLRIDRLDAELVAQIRALPAIADLRLRRTVAATMQADGTTRTVLLFALDDYTRITIGRLQSEAGPWPPRDGEIVIEHSALEFSGAHVGGNVSLHVGRAATHTFPVSGIARDVSLAPGWMDHVVYAFVTPATMAQLGVPSDFDEIQIRVREPSLDRDGVRRVAQQVKALIEQHGAHVVDIDVPAPGKHMHADQMNSVLLTQAAFAVLTLIVCALLVVNLIGATLAAQVREIGILKTLGASDREIASMYLVFALLLGLSSALLALPAAVAIGRAYAQFKSEMLNFPLADMAIPAWVIVSQIAAGALLAVIAAALPVRRGCRIPVAVALRDVGIADEAPRRERRLFGLDGFARPILLSLDNALRKRKRLILTLLALAAGGAVFLGAANLRAAVIASLEQLYAGQHYDFTLRLAQGAPPAALEAIARAAPGVARAEAWSYARATPIYADGLQGNGIDVVGLAPDTTLLQPRIGLGRWLLPSDRNALVVSLALWRNDPSLVPGAQITLRIHEKMTTFTLVGIVETGWEGIAYTPRDALAEIAGDDRASSLVVAGSDGSVAAQLDLIQQLRGALEHADIEVASSHRVAETRRAAEDHLLMVLQFLSSMGWVMILVGGMGLASTMSLAVLERTREIGVLRAIGARHRDIFASIEIEGLVIALLAWLAALPLSLPISLLLGAAFGRIMFPVPAAFLPAGAGVLAWLCVVVVVALVACAWPAWRAMRVPAASALAYE
jgi:putative ABC transport system permease protein